MDFPPPDGPCRMTRSPAANESVQPRSTGSARPRVRESQIGRVEDHGGRRVGPSTRSRARFRSPPRRGAKDRRRLPPGDRRAREAPDSSGQPMKGLEPEQDSAEADRERRRATQPPVRTRRAALRPTGPTSIHPRGHDRQQPDRRAIHRRRRVHVAFERFIFALVPLAPRLLRDARAMADHRFDQIERQADAQCAPSPGGDGRRPTRARRRRVHRTSSTRGAATRCASTPAASNSSSAASSAMNPPPSASDSTASASITRPSSCPAPSRRISSGSSRNAPVSKPLLQQGADRDRDPALEPERRELQRHQREERQRPCREPRCIESTLQGRTTQQPPRDNPQPVLARVRERQQHELSPARRRRRSARRSWRPTACGAARHRASAAPAAVPRRAPATPTGSTGERRFLDQPSRFGDERRGSESTSTCRSVFTETADSR